MIDSNKKKLQEMQQSPDDHVVNIEILNKKINISKDTASDISNIVSDTNLKADNYVYIYITNLKQIDKVHNDLNRKQ